MPISNQHLNMHQSTRDLYRKVLDMECGYTVYINEVMPHQLDILINSSNWWDIAVHVILNKPGFISQFVTTCQNRQITTIRYIDYRGIASLIKAGLDVNWLQNRLETGLVHPSFWDMY